MLILTNFKEFVWADQRAKVHVYWTAETVNNLMFLVFHFIFRFLACMHKPYIAICVCSYR